MPTSRAVKQPSVKEVWQASMSLGYSPQTTEKAALPKAPWEKTGLVIVKKAGPRNVVLRAIAGEIVKNRQKQVQVSEPKRK